jgi:L-amino acid N-acyltransferase YncA
VGDEALPVVRVVRDPARLAAVVPDAAVAESVVGSWCRDGVAFVLTDLAAARGDEVVGVALCGPVATSVELRLLVLPNGRAEDAAGRRLLEGTVNALRGLGAHRVAVSIHSSDRAALALLQRVGFQIEGVDGESDASAGDVRSPQVRRASVRLVLDL